MGILPEHSPGVKFSLKIKELWLHFRFCRRIPQRIRELAPSQGWRSKPSKPGSTPPLFA